jgi:tetratricopeptide (TPR) repeat protein
VESYTWRGLARVDSGDYAGAAADLTAAIDRGQEDPYIRLQRATAYFMLDDYAVAAENCTTVLAHDPALAHAYQLRALAHARLQKPAEAEADCRQALEHAPEEPLTHLAWSEFYLMQEAYEAAVAACRQALNLAPEAGHHFALGLAHLLAGELELGLNAYEQGFANATTIDKQLARLDLDYWSARQPERWTADAVQGALQRIRDKLTLVAE